MDATNIHLIKGDITQSETEAVVNAANTSLLGGGGVDGAIHRAGGGKILEECIKIRNKQGGCQTGEAVITTAGDLKAKYVIHTVGPVWQGGDAKEEQLLRNCYMNTLKIAMDKGIKSIAFPNISTGIYRFPKDKAAQIAMNAVANFMNENNYDISVTFVCYSDENYNLYKKIIDDILT